MGVLIFTGLAVAVAAVGSVLFRRQIKRELEARRSKRWQILVPRARLVLIKREWRLVDFEFHSEVEFVPLPDYYAERHPDEMLVIDTQKLAEFSMSAMLDEPSTYRFGTEIDSDLWRQLRMDSYVQSIINRPYKLLITGI